MSVMKYSPSKEQVLQAPQTSHLPMLLDQHDEDCSQPEEW